MKHHPEEDPLSKEYLWEPTGFYNRPMMREISEAVKIKEALAKEGPKSIVMNEKKSSIGMCFQG